MYINIFHVLLTGRHQTDQPPEAAEEGAHHQRDRRDEGDEEPQHRQLCGQVRAGAERRRVAATRQCVTTCVCVCVLVS